MTIRSLPTAKQGGKRLLRVGMFLALTLVFSILLGMTASALSELEDAEGSGSAPFDSKGEGGDDHP